MKSDKPEETGPTRRKSSKIINFCWFFSQCSYIPQHAPTKFESSIAILLPVKTLKFQPNWPTGVRVTGHAMWQIRRKTAKIINFCRFFSHNSRIPRPAPTKFKSSIAIPSPNKLLKFQPNWRTGSRAIDGNIGPFYNTPNHFFSLGGPQ